MKKPIFLVKTTLLLSLWLTLSATAGSINILHLGPAADAKITILCQGKKQPITLKQGEDSGTFTLPAAVATIQYDGKKESSLDVDTRKSGKIVVLLTEQEKSRWHSYDSKPNDTENSVRLINLTGQAIKATIATQEISLDDKAEHESIKITSASIAVKLDGEKKRSIKPEERGAYLAIAYKEGDKTMIRFIADR